MVREFENVGDDVCANRVNYDLYSKQLVEALDQSRLQGVLDVMHYVKDRYGLPALTIVAEHASAQERHSHGLDLHISARRYSPQSELAGENPIPEVRLTQAEDRMHVFSAYGPSSLSKVKNIFDRAAQKTEQDSVSNREKNVNVEAQFLEKLLKEGKTSEFSRHLADHLYEVNSSQPGEITSPAETVVVDKNFVHRVIARLQESVPRESFTKYLPPRQMHDTAAEIIAAHNQQFQAAVDCELLGK